jgi:hypothetical protein
MKRFIIGLLAACALVACIDSPADQTSTEDGHTFTVGGQPAILFEGPSRAEEPLASYSEAGVIAAGCRVTLDWCVTPGSGIPSCTARNCTLERAISACESLIDDTCGLN